MQTSIIQTLGIKATTFTNTLKAADLDWEPMEDAVCGRTSGVVIPGKKLLFRSDTKEPLGVVGKEYSASDPRVFLEEQFRFADSIGGKVVRAGFISAHASAFAFIQCGPPINIPRKDRKVGDPIQAYLYSTDGWNGGRPCSSRLYVERLVCSNGMTSKEIEANLWVSHTSGRSLRYSERREAFLAEVKEQRSLIEIQFKRLVEQTMTAEAAKEFFQRLLPGGSSRTASRREKLEELFNTGTGNHGSTRWDAYNAVTEYVTHHRSYRQTELTSPETNRFLSVMETDALAPAALRLLLN